MIKLNKLFALLEITASWLQGNVSAQNITVQVNKPVATIQPTMWGVFFEDINLGADGGIYAELIKNRSFEFFRPMMGWRVLGRPATEGDFLVINRKEANSGNPRFLRVTLRNNAKGSLGLNNEGFRSMGIKKDLRYDFSVMYRHQGSPVKLHLELINAKREIIGTNVVTLPATNGEEWKTQASSFTATATEPKASFNTWMEGDG